MKTLSEIKAILRKEKKYLYQEYAVSYLGLFGSYVRSEQNEYSDVDLLIDFEAERYPGFKFFELEDYLSKILDLKIDLVPLDTLKKRIGAQILSEVQEI